MSEQPTPTPTHQSEQTPRDVILKILDIYGRFVYVPEYWSPSFDAAIMELIEEGLLRKATKEEVGEWGNRDTYFSPPQLQPKPRRERSSKKDGVTKAKRNTLGKSAKGG